MPKTTGQELINTFLTYNYVGYAWGGASPDTGWDCSGACNYVVGWLYKLAIPGYGPGEYGPGKGHGPDVGEWCDWIGVGKGAFPNVRPSPGDLIAWQPNVHMGMAVNATQFMSAENPSAGTRVDDISGFFNWDPLVLRIIQLGIGPSLPSLPGAPGPGADDYSPHIHSAGEQVSAAGIDVAKYATAIRGLRLGKA